MEGKEREQLERIKKRIADGEYYEAHQMLKTASARYMKQNKPQAAAELLYEGGVELNRKGQHSSASDVGLAMLEVYGGEGWPPSQREIARVQRLFEGFPPGEPTKGKFMKAAIAWSGKYGEEPSGDPGLRHLYGLSFWKEGNYKSAQIQFLKGTEQSARAMAEMLFELSYSEAYATEKEYLLARAILQYIALGNLRDAFLCYSDYVSRLLQRDSSLSSTAATLPSAATPPGMPSNTMVASTVQVHLFAESPFPLLNFCALVILTAQRDSAELFKLLRKKYQPALSRDPSLNQLLDQIGHSYFNIVPPSSRSNPFGDIFKSLFGGEDMLGGGPPAQNRPSGRLPPSSSSGSRPSGGGPSSAAADLD